MPQITLKIKHSNLKSQFDAIKTHCSSNNFNTRVHRAISWLKTVEDSKELDIVFIQLWISFNSVYAVSINNNDAERSVFKKFFDKIVELDHERLIHSLLLSKYSGAIRVLIENKYTFEPFWHALRTHDSSGFWKDNFAKAKKRATKALLDNQTAELLAIIFDRIYTIRNQIFHGGATFESAINREQLKQVCHILTDIVPLIIQIMINNKDADFGDIAYPVVM